MERCCWFVSLEAGAVFSAIIFLIIGMAEMFLEKWFVLLEVERAVIILHAFIFMAGALLLLIGLLVDDLVCIFLFVFFGFGAILAKIAAIAVFMTSEARDTIDKTLIIVYSIILFMVHLYVILVAYSFGKKLWQQQHHDVRMSVRLHRWGHHHRHTLMGA